MAHTRFAKKEPTAMLKPQPVESPEKKAEKTAKWAHIMTKWLITYSQNKGARWNVVAFGGKRGHESAGIVDLMAIRKSHRSGAANAGNVKGLKRGDLFEIILIQVKGGSARKPSSADIARLVKVQHHHKAKAVVLAEWTKGQGRPIISVLRRGTWVEDDGLAVFGHAAPALIIS